MTIQNLLEGLKSLLEKEYIAADLKFRSAGDNRVLPDVFIGFAPNGQNADGLACTVIYFPEKVSDDEVSEFVSLKLSCGVLYDKSSENQGEIMDILTLLERTKDILMRNNTIGAFRRFGSLNWSIKAGGTEASLNKVSGDIEITYETKSSYMEDENQ